MNPDAPVPEDQQLACLLWQCHYLAVNGHGDGTMTWWTLQPIERAWWQGTADRLRDSAWWSRARPELNLTPVLGLLREVRDVEHVPTYLRAEADQVLGEVFGETEEQDDG